MSAIGGSERAWYIYEKCIDSPDPATEGQTGRIFIMWVAIRVVSYVGPSHCGDSLAIHATASYITS